jgi:hypothetical protein
MSELTIAELGAMKGREYINEVKARLTDDAQWLVLVEPELEESTRWALTTILDSIERQKARETLSPASKWLRSMESLRRLCQSRLDGMEPLPEPASHNRETKAWRAFSARLARVLDDYDPTALDELQAPYGGLTARQWLDSRQSKTHIREEARR